MSNGLNISLKSYDSIFQSEEQRNTEEIKPVPISELKPFTEQPFKVKLDEDMDALVESIKQCGVQRRLPMSLKPSGRKNAESSFSP